MSEHEQRDRGYLDERDAAEGGAGAATSGRDEPHRRPRTADTGPRGRRMALADARREHPERQLRKDRARELPTLDRPVERLAVIARARTRGRTVA